MQGAPGVGRGMTVDFSEDVPVPSSQHADSRSVVTAPIQTPRPGSASDKPHMRLAANFGDSTHDVHHQDTSDTMVNQGSLYQEVQLRQMQQQHQKQFEYRERTKAPPMNQLEPSPMQGQFVEGGEKQWFMQLTQQQLQQTQQQQLHIPAAAGAKSSGNYMQQPPAPATAQALMPPQRDSHQIQILKRPPKPIQPTVSQFQQPQLYPLQQMLPQQHHMQQQQSPSKQEFLQQTFQGISIPSPIAPQNISPPLLDLASLPFIDTSKPPPPIGVPIPSLPFPTAGPPPVPLCPPPTAKLPSPRQPVIPQHQVKSSPNTWPAAERRPHPDKRKATVGGEGSAFAGVPEAVWDSIPLGGGYASGNDTPSPAFLPRGGELHPQASGRGSPQQTEQNQSKGSFKPTREGIQGRKQWIKKDKTKGHGFTKKEPQGVGASPANKPAQAYGTTTSSNQPQDPGGALSKEQAKNEYDWQSFKIVRKVRKVLGALKNECNAKEAAAEIAGIMTAESGRLACFPWPKEQFVALDEILGWAIDRPEMLETICKLIQELHNLHPANFQEDLTNTMMKRHTQYIKVSTATNKEKLYSSYSGLVANLFLLSRNVNNSFQEIINKLVDLIVNKWIISDVQGTADDPVMPTEVYAFCLRVLFIVIGPQLDGRMDQKYNELLRDQVLGNQPRFMKEAMLDLLLLRAVGWKGSPEFKTESTSDSMRESTSDSKREPATEENQNAVGGENVPEDNHRVGLSNVTDNPETSKPDITSCGDAPSADPSSQPTNLPETKVSQGNSVHPITSDVSSLDKGKTKSLSHAKDSAFSIPPKNDGHLGQDTVDRPDSSAANPQADSMPTDFTDSTAKFRLPDKEVAERGAIILSQVPYQTPNIQAPPGNSPDFNVAHCTTRSPHGFSPGVATSSPSSWQLPSTHLSQEMQAAVHHYSTANPTPCRPVPSKTPLGDSLQDVQASWNGSFFTGSSQANLGHSGFQSTNGSLAYKFADPSMPLSSFPAKTATPADTKLSPDVVQAEQSSPSTKPTHAFHTESSRENMVPDTHAKDRKPDSPAPANLSDSDNPSSHPITDGISSDAALDVFKKLSTASVSLTGYLPKCTSPYRSTSAGSSLHEPYLSTPNTSTTMLDTLTSGDVGITGLSEERFPEQFRSPQRVGSASGQFSVNNNNNSSRTASCSGELDKDTKSQDSRDVVDSTNDLEQQPAPVSSAGDYGPSQVFLLQQKLLPPHDKEDRRLGGIGSVASKSEDTGDPRGGIDYGQMRKGHFSHSFSAAGSPRSSCSVFGRGMMRPEQGIGSGDSSAACFMTSPLAFIQATSSPQRNVTRKQVCHVREAAVEQSRSDAEMKDKVPPSGLLQEKHLSSDYDFISGQGCFKLDDGTNNTGALQETKTENDTEAPQNLLNTESDALKISGFHVYSPLWEGHIQEGPQPALDVTNGYFDGQDSQEGQHVKDIFRKTGFRAPKFMSEKDSEVMDVGGKMATEVTPEPLEDNLIGSHEAANQGELSEKALSVSYQPSQEQEGCKKEQLVGIGSPPAALAKPPMKCPLCGSGKHRTRQCPTFKKYAPRAKTSDEKPEPEQETPEAKKSTTESKFGNTFFCSKCGQEGHLIYDCPVKGNFNFFS